MTTIVIMPGGFHPFHAGHYALYQSAQRAFPGAEVFVAATNDTSARPFPFAVKEKLAKLAGVEPGHFVQVRSPFRAEEITSKFDPARDRLIFVRSEKDADKPPQAGGVKRDGSAAYLQPLAGQTNIRPFKEHAYMAYLPTVEFGPGMTSATEIRTAWPALNEKRKTALVMSLYPQTQGNLKLADVVVKLLDAAIGTQEVDEGRKKKKSSRSLGGYFFPGYGYYGGGDSGEGGGDGGGGGESVNRGMAEGRLNEIYKMPPTKDSSQGMTTWAYNDAVEKKSPVLYRDDNVIIFKSNEDLLRYIILQNGNPVLYIGFSKFLDGYKSGTVATEIVGRGKGLAQKAYLNASDILGVPIYSDTTQTDASRLGIWDKLIQQYPDRIVGYDQKTNKNLPLSLSDMGPVVNQNQPIYVDRNKKDTKKPISPSQRYRTRVLKLLPTKQGVAEGWKDVVAGGALALGALGAGAQTMPNINAQQVELTNKYYNALVQRAKEDGRELDRRTLNFLKAKAEDAAALKLQQASPKKQQGFPAQGSERRVSRNIDNFESQGVAENFADGRNPQDKGDAKRHGINTKASVSSLRKTAKQGGRKGQLAHWLANMKSGRAKNEDVDSDYIEEKWSAKYKSSINCADPKGFSQKAHCAGRKK